VRVALDTNVLVSAVAARGLCADIFNLVLAEHELIVGETVLAELKRVLREKIRVPSKLVEEYIYLLRTEAVVVKQGEPLVIAIRDKSDIPVLGDAIAGKAEVLVTGDKDLLDVSDTLPLRILTPRGLWEELRHESAQPR
jgi:putative PIN family toxin of toxin-antitoxin system